MSTRKLMIAIGLFPLLAFASGGSVGNGGAGCIATDGHVITFYDCGIYHAPTNGDIPPPDAALPIDAPSETPQGLTELTQFVQNMPYLEKDSKNTILAAITPTIYRKYFSVVPADLTQPVQTRILFQFKNVTGKDPSQLELFGVTDTRASLSYINRPGQITYLLPGFSKIATLHGKMAALFHEAWWVMHPDSNEEAAVAAEMSLQAVLDAPNDPSKLLNFVKLFEVNRYPGNPETYFSRNVSKLILRTDIESGALKGFVDSSNRITSWQLFGKDVIDCYNGIHSASDPYSADDECKLRYVAHLNALRTQYPRSLFLATIGQYVNVSAKKARMNQLLSDVFNKIQGDGFAAVNYYPFSCLIPNTDFGCTGPTIKYPLEKQLFPNWSSDYAPLSEAVVGDTIEDQLIQIQLNYDAASEWPMSDVTRNQS